MMKICLCFKIHIPAIHLNYRFFDIDLHHPYYDNSQLRNHTLKVYYNNVLPFFETVKNLTKTYDEKFKAAISISGITLALFKRFAPQAIESLLELRQKNHIEFLSETWSNSILAHSSSRLMIRQIVMHNAYMKSMLGIVPDVFITHSPVSSQGLFNTIFDCGKKTILTYSNNIHQLNPLQNNDSENRTAGKRQVFLINYKASKALHEIDLNLKMASIDDLPSAVAKKVKRILSVSVPQAIIFNPGDINKPFTMGDSMIWRIVISHLITDPDITFLFPSELKNSQNRLTTYNLDKGKGKCCKLPDLWLKNDLQKDAFSRQLSVNKLMPFAEIKSLVEEWDVIHDMDYLYYMGNSFFEPKFAEAHFNPYSSPYMAYTNYMNVLDDFAGKITIPKKNILKKRSVQKTKEKYY